MPPAYPGSRRGGEMIELRWLIRKVPRERGIDDGIYQPPLPDLVDSQVLQYREWPKGTIAHLYEPTWTDVPTVKAEGK